MTPPVDHAPAATLADAADAAADAVVVSFTSSFAEQVDVARSIHRGTRQWQAAMLLFAGVPLALAVRKGLTDGMSGEVVVLGFAAALSLVFWNYGIAWIAVRGGRRGMPSPDGPFTWTIDGTGLRLEGPATDVRLAPSAIVDVKETPDVFLLYVSRTIAQFIPKRAVAPADLSRLRQLLRKP